MGTEQQDMPAGLTLGTESQGDAQRRFWLTHMRIGFSVFLAETLVVLAYLALTPHLPHRHVLWIVVLAWLAFALLGFGTSPMVAGKTWRVRYSVLWTVLSAFAVGGVALLDRGTQSPVLVLLFLPLIYAALMFTPKESALCGGSALLVAAIVATVERGTLVSLGSGLVLFGVLGGASVLSVAASVNRTRIERHERALLAAVAELAATDELTGCTSRRVFCQRVEEEIDRSFRHDTALSLMMIDVDGFKTMNDTYGHLVGDGVLARVGAVLRQAVRSSDVVGRWGGDEFAVLLPHTEASSAAETAERVRGVLADAVEVPVTLSIGISSLERRTENPAEQLFDDADFALYQVKRAGRDAVAVRSHTPVN